VVLSGGGGAGRAGRGLGQRCAPGGWRVKGWGWERLLLPPRLCVAGGKEQGGNFFFLTNSLLSKKYSSGMSDNIC